MLIVLSLSLSFVSCDTHQKVLKSSDINYKYEKAIEYYDKGDYYKAMPLLEELLGYFKGTEKTEQLYYYFTNCHFKQRNYIIAAYHYKNFVTLHPGSEYAEECLYRNAECFYLQSPKPSLEQTNSLKAIDAFQYFINSYPESERVARANEVIDELRGKLEDKEYENAKLYFKTANYRAAATSYRNILKIFPDIDEAEEISFMIVKSAEKFASNSIAEKQSERYVEVIEAYKDFKARYPVSDYDAEADELHNSARVNSISSNLTYAKSLKLEKREAVLKQVIKAYGIHYRHIEGEKEKTFANSALEEAYFLIVKTNYQLAQAADKLNKGKRYDSTIKSYYSFIDKYSQSKFAREAERMYQASAENVSKNKSDGQN